MHEGDGMSDKTKKIVWLSVGISFFLLVVAGAAFLLFLPSPSNSAAPFSLTGKSEPKSKAPQDYVANLPVSTMETTTTTKSGDIIIVYGNGDSTATTIQAPVPSSAPNTTSAQPAPVTTTIVVAPPAPKSIATTTTTVAKQPQASPPSATTAKTTATTTTTATKPASSDYWIQAGSFSSKATADKLKEAFQERGMVAVITVKDINGKSYYQVKVGPYPSRDEAKKWIQTVKSVPGASAEAFVTQ